MKKWQQDLFPQHTLSRLMGWLASAKLGVLTRFFIRWFVRHYQVNLSEAKISDPCDFSSFNDFFTRELKPGARQINLDQNKLISPVDGAVSEIGKIEKDQLLQAKGAYYSVSSLCGDSASLAATFMHGAFLTAYLSPKDYHRFHMPITGTLVEMIYVPGHLYSVNKSSVANVPALFAKNERVIFIFETAIGKVAMIAVGAMIVGSVETRFHGIVSPQKDRVISRWVFDQNQEKFEQGEELGRFRLGSTIILLCEKDSVEWDQGLRADSSLLLGQEIGKVA